MDWRLASLSPITAGRNAGRILRGTSWRMPKLQPTQDCRGPKSFSSDELAFQDQGASGTRLGARDLIVTLPDGVNGPFGKPIRSISIPSHWLGSIQLEEDVAPQIVSRHPVELHFSVQREQFAYDRFGLRRSGSCRSPAQWGK